MPDPILGAKNRKGNKAKFSALKTKQVEGYRDIIS